MSNVIDLDALVPASVTVKFGEQEIEIKPPKTKDILKLGSLSDKLKSAADLPEAELEGLINQLIAGIGGCIPELAGKDFNTAQLLKLVEILSDMSIPPDTKELDKRGISVGDPKVPSA